MEEINFISKISEPPKDLVQWLKKKGCFKKEWLIYQCGWDTDDSGNKSKCLDVVCTACGHHFTAERDNDAHQNCGCSYGYASSYYSKYRGHSGECVIEDSKKTKCPLCGAEVECMHVGRIGRGEVGIAYPIILSKDGKNLILTAFQVSRALDKQGVSNYLVQKYEAYVFTPKKAYRYCAWYACMDTRILTDRWEIRKRYSDMYGCGKLIYPIGKNVFCGTPFENSKFHKYISCCQSERECYPVSYLMFYRKHPQAENLLVQGYGRLVAEAIRMGTCNDAVNWKEVSPRKMLGLSKLDYEFLKEKQAESHDIVNFRKLRQADASVKPQEVMDVIQTFKYSLDEITKHGKSACRIARYCVKQVGKKEQRENETPSNALITWNDYISMAENLGYNLKDDSTRFPPHLYAAHDRAVMATKYKENPELIEKFKAMYECLLPYSFEKDGLLIQPAASEEELIKEGKILQHCVGGYGKTHCSGNPIFFIRKAAEPDIPYYTLQLNLKKKVIIQNHGYRDDALMPVPSEVNKFAYYWLENVVKAAPAKKKKNRATAA